jgi:dinuclear metal center YbgI/SA1388 family protein
MKLADVLRTLEELAPLRYAESWDNVGLIVGDPEAEVRRILVTVDYSAAVATEAREKGANLVVAYHPPLFAPVKRVPHHAPWAEAIRYGIALYSPHTALDVARGGTNDFLADACKVSPTARVPLRPWSGPRSPSDAEGIGLGRAGEVARVSLGELADRVKRALRLERVLVAGSLDSVVKRVAVAAGAGGELLADAVTARVDAFVTGEVRHHDALSALARGVAVIATLHSNSERSAIAAFAEQLGGRVGGVDVVASALDSDPFRFV